MMAAPSSHPCSSRKYVGSVVSADCKDGEIFRLEEPQFPKWEIYCFLDCRTSWRVSEADEARACHKGEPQRLRLRVEEEARLGDQKGQGILEKEACCALRHTGLLSEELLCLK